MVQAGHPGCCGPSQEYCIDGTGLQCRCGREPSATAAGSSVLLGRVAAAPPCEQTVAGRAVYDLGPVYWPIPKQLQTKVLTLGGLFQKRRKGVALATDTHTYIYGGLKKRRLNTQFLLPDQMYLKTH